MSSRIGEIEVWMAEDGTYTLHDARAFAGGRVVERTVAGAESIPEGLEQMAIEMRAAAVREFMRGREEN